MKYGLILFIGVLIAFMGCKQQDVKQAQEASTLSTDQATDQPTTPPFTLRISSGGGMTGLVKGYTLTDDGKVQHWQHFPGQPDSLLWTVQAEPRDTYDYAKSLIESEAVKKSYDETGNMTTTVQIESGSLSKSWSWAGTGTGEHVPAEFAEWYPRILDFCKKVKPQGQ